MNNIYLNIYKYTEVLIDLSSAIITYPPYSQTKCKIKGTIKALKKSGSLLKTFPQCGLTSLIGINTLSLKS